MKTRPKGLTSKEILFTTDQGLSMKFFNEPDHWMLLSKCSTIIICCAALRDSEFMIALAPTTMMSGVAAFT